MSKYFFQDICCAVLWHPHNFYNFVCRHPNFFYMATENDSLHQVITSINSGQRMQAMLRVTAWSILQWELSDLINLHSISSQNQSPSTSVASMGCLVKLQGCRQDCPMPTEWWSRPTKQTHSEMGASNTHSLWINELMLMSPSINTALVFSFPPSFVDLVTDLWEEGCGMWPQKDDLLVFSICSVWYPLWWHTLVVLWDGTGQPHLIDKEPLRFFYENNRNCFPLR